MRPEAKVVGKEREYRSAVQNKTQIAQREKGVIFIVYTCCPMEVAMTVALAHRTGRRFEVLSVGNIRMFGDSRKLVHELCRDEGITHIFRFACCPSFCHGL